MRHVPARFLFPPVLAAVAIIAVLAGCQASRPLERSQITTLADNMQIREGLSWGSPREVMEPGPADADGHRWWQLRYVESKDPGAARIILVDADSGWARLPPAGWTMRIVPHPAPPVTVPTLVKDGSAILVVIEPQPVTTPRLGELEREAARLNAIAARTDLWPLFKVHTDKAGRTSLIYGWQGDRGIAQDDRIRDWIQIRAGVKTARWVDLSAM